MKVVSVLCAVCAIAVAGFILGRPAASIFVPPAPVDDSVISSTPCDIDADGTNETIEIAIVNGTLWDREWDSCESGEIWEGSFEVRVVDCGSLLSSVCLNELMGRDSLFF